MWSEGRGCAGVPRESPCLVLLTLTAGLPLPATVQSLHAHANHMLLVTISVRAVLRSNLLVQHHHCALPCHTCVVVATSPWSNSC